MRLLLKLATPVSAGLLVFAMMFVRVCYFYFEPDEVLIGVIPDDAFYYLHLARQRVVHGVWTFDGNSPATGFHFLYAWSLVGVRRLFGELDWRTIFLAVGCIASASIGLAAGLVCRTAGRLFGQSSVPLAAAPFLTVFALMQGTALMESWLVLFFSAATICVLAVDRRPSLASDVALVAVGVFGSLSRTDFGMLPGVMFLVFLASRRWTDGWHLRQSVLVLAGAVLGLAVVLAQNLLISGEAFQASAKTKLHWSAAVGHNIRPAVNLVINTLLPSFGTPGRLTKAATLLALVALVAWSAHSLRRGHEPGKRLPALGVIVAVQCLLTVSGYVLFYRYNSQDVQNWYSSNLVAPLGILLAAFGHFTLRQRLQFPALVLLGVYATAGALQVPTVPWPNQAGMFRAAKFLGKTPPQSVYGA